MKNSNKNPLVNCIEISFSCFEQLINSSKEPEKTIQYKDSCISKFVAFDSVVFVVYQPTSKAQYYLQDINA